MIERLAGAIEELLISPHGEAIAEARRLADHLEAKIAEAEVAYAAAGGPAVEGYADLAGFARHRCGATLTDSRRVARRAKRLRMWPCLAEAWREGRVSGTHVELLCAIVPDRHVERFMGAMPGLIDTIAALSARHAGQHLRRTVERADAFAEREAVEAGREPPITPPPARELSASRSLDDALFLSGHVTGDDAAHVEKALVAATRPDRPGERRTPKERRADALVEVCRRYLETIDNPDAKRSTERLTICADVVTLYRAWLRGAGVRTADELEDFLAERPRLGELDRGLFLDAFDHTSHTARTLDGNPVTDALVAAVAAGGAMELLLTAAGRILHLGRSTRTFSAAQRRAVLARDGGCRSPGCHAGPERCDIHHVRPWDDGGATDITNAVAKCRHCHLDHHRRALRDQLEPDGTYTVTAPDGTHRTTHPPGWNQHPAPIVVPTTSRPAPEAILGAPTFGHRCGCPCDRHPDPHERARIDHARHLTLRRVRLLKLELERGA